MRAIHTADGQVCLKNQTVVRSTDTADPLLSLSYDYANANGKRTGQLTKILNNLNHNKDRGYSYDALGRLVQATGGPSTSPLWTQSYSYDRYGNRTSVTASGNSAANKSAFRNPQSEIAKRPVSEPRALATGSIARPSEPSVDLPTDLLAKNNSVDLPTSSAMTTSHSPTHRPPSAVHQHHRAVPQPSPMIP